MTNRALQKYIWLWVLTLVGMVLMPSSLLAEEKIAVFPTKPVDVYTVYTSLAIFWLMIVALIIMIRMKLKEINRIQKLGLDRDDPESPLLE
jgi:uncharacterized membrane protein